MLDARTHMHRHVCACWGFFFSLLASRSSAAFQNHIVLSALGGAVPCTNLDMWDCCLKLRGSPESENVLAFGKLALLILLQRDGWRRQSRQRFIMHEATAQHNVSRRSFAARWRAVGLERCLVLLF